MLLARPTIRLICRPPKEKRVEPQTYTPLKKLSVPSSILTDLPMPLEVLEYQVGAHLSAELLLQFGPVQDPLLLQLGIHILGLGLSQLEWHVGDQVSGHGPQVQLDAQDVRDNDADGVLVVQRRRRQARIRLLEQAVERDAAPVSVLRGQRQQVEDLGEGGPRQHRAVFPALNGRHHLAVVAVHQRHLRVLQDENLDVFDALLGVVGHRHLGVNLVVVEVHLLVEHHLELHLARAQHEPLADDGGRLALPLRERRVLDLADGHVDGAAPVSLLLLVLGHVHAELVLDSQRPAAVVWARLQRHRHGCVRGQVEAERVRPAAQLAEEPLLQVRDLGDLVALGDNLVVRQEQLPVEVQAHDFILFSAVSEGGDHLAEYLAALQVVWVENHDTFDRVAHVASLSEVPLSDVDGHLSVGRRLLEHLHGHDEAQEHEVRHGGASRRTDASGGKRALRRLAPALFMRFGDAASWADAGVMRSGAETAQALGIFLIRAPVRLRCPTLESDRQASRTDMSSVLILVRLPCVAIRSLPFLISCSCFWSFWNFTAFGAHSFLQRYQNHLMPKSLVQISKS
ncbi:unnamed protein product [Ixodes persulcatus]